MSEFSMNLKLNECQLSEASACPCSAERCSETFGKHLGRG